MVETDDVLTLLKEVAEEVINPRFRSLASAEKEAAAAAKVPLGRVAEPEDITGAILFFASHFADYITGQTLLVDGGRTTRSA